MTETVYLVVESDIDGGGYVRRAYSERAMAEAFVEAYNATTSGYYEVEEVAVDQHRTAAYDGPVWVGTWTTRRKLKGEKQLVVTADGFTAVVPSAVPSVGVGTGYQTLAGPGWRELTAVVEYEEPPVWIDRFDYRQEWHTGERPSPAAIDDHCGCVRVRGTSRAAVEELLRATALHVKAEKQ